MEDLTGNTIFRGDGLNKHGREILRLSCRVRILENALARVQWNGPEERLGPCPGCGQYSPQGHQDNCFLAGALQDLDPLERMDETVRFLLDAVRCCANSLAVQSSAILGTLADLQATLDDAAIRIEGR